MQKNQLQNQIDKFLQVKNEPVPINDCLTDNISHLNH